MSMVRIAGRAAVFVARVASYELESEEKVRRIMGVSEP